ncbi:hypothetical protein [Rhodococcus marinonascens]|uniref:hypothetical protein n=1 Tax=Rhodococcus marinonascens TaxID=38311 RepID=UPI000AA704F5|nr:hypothetical protein [Rhodococcus marinonascens]
MPAPTHTQAGGYTLTPEALRDAGLLGVSIEDVRHALLTPTKSVCQPRADGRCLTRGTDTQGHGLAGGARAG